jgi:cytochrome c-type biogenesis protein CcmH/NrfG
MLAGDLEEAARIAHQNLQNKAMPDASDWVLLGDIRHKQGLIAEAQAAYARAIDAVTSRTQRRTAAVDPPAGITPQSPLPQ